MSDAANEAQREADLARVKAHVDQLAEHFDSVQIFVSRHMPAELEGTRSMNWGSGNWFARYGQVREWLIYEDAKVADQARRSQQDQ